MSEQSVVTVVVALFALLGGAGFWGYLSSRKEAPIKKRDADVAAAHTSQQMALSVAEDLRTDVDRLRADVTQERSAREELGRQLDIESRERRNLSNRVEEQGATIHNLRAALRAFKDAWLDLNTNWQVIRLQEDPPPEPRIYLDYTLKEEAS